jgi:hypothetical protein
VVWFRPYVLVVCYLWLLGGLGDVLGRQDGGGPWLGGVGGCFWWGSPYLYFFMWQCGTSKGFCLLSKWARLGS